MRDIISMLLASTPAANTAPSLVVGQHLDRNGRVSIVIAITGEQVAMGDFDGDSHHMPLYTCLSKSVSAS